MVHQMRIGERKFWNDPQVVEWFSKYPASDYLVDLFKEKKDELNHVLDLGCGAGRNTEMLTQLGLEVYAADLSEGMVAATRQRLSKMGFKTDQIVRRAVQANMLDLPFSDGFFDAVVAMGVYHNAHDLREFESALAETVRVLRPQGYLYYNLFSSELIAQDISRVKDREGVYQTKEGLLMVLVDSVRFLKTAKTHGLEIFSPMVEYQTDVSTGKRSVMRGVLVKPRIN